MLLSPSTPLRGSPTPEHAPVERRSSGGPADFQRRCVGNVTPVRISLLGPLQVDGAPGDVSLGAAKERSLLAALALHPEAVVSTDALVRALWGDQPPASARKTLQTYISNLRQALGGEAIETDPSGYALHVAPDDVDVARFRSLVRSGEAALRDGDATTARNALRDALALWRGAPFTDVAAHTGLANEAVCLGEERLSALEMRISADLADGAHAALVAELEGLVRDHPYRERLWGDLMVALYRCGRQADALATYQRARSILADDLGLDPGGELRRIEEAILNQDASMAAPSGPSTDVSRTIGTTNGILRSPVRYAKSSGDVSIAFQVAGDGPLDILAIPGFREPPRHLVERTDRRAGPPADVDRSADRLRQARHGPVRPAGRARA